MRWNDAVTVYLHSDQIIPDCDCGERSWQVQLPTGWWWVTSAGPGSFVTLNDAMTYALGLNQTHPDVCDDFPQRRCAQVNA